MDVHTAVIITIGAALLFDLINGFHDAANSIATVVSTRVLSPRQAVLWAAFFNMAAYFLIAPHVAKTISGMVRVSGDDPVFVYVVLAGLIGASGWDLATWWWGLPTSSSHALLGGFIGAGMAYKGWAVVNEAKFYQTVKFIVIAPMVGFGIAFVLMLSVYWLFRRARPSRVDRGFRAGQLLSAAAYSLGHGTNDAQKTMGLIAAVLIATGKLSPDFEHLPSWVAFSCFGAMGLGTAFGGWRIVKTMGMKLTKLRPVGGFCAETAGAITLFFMARHGIPVSTTHTITGAIIGVGSTTTTPSAIKWGVAQRILWAWVLTIPASAAVGAGCFWLLQHLQLW